MCWVARDGTRCRPRARGIAQGPLCLVSHGGRGRFLWRRYDHQGSTVRDLLELSSQLPGGMDDVRVARSQADTSALADAYRAALGASKTSTEKAQAALDAIDAFEASGKTMADAARLMMSCTMPRASKAFPKEQAELLKAEAADARSSISCLPAVARRSMRWWAWPVPWRRSTVRSRPTSPRSTITICCAWRLEALRDYPAIRAAYEGQL